MEDKSSATPERSKWAARLRRGRYWLAAALLVCAIVFVSGCRTIGFYAQAAKGQYQILAGRRAITKILDDPHAPERLKTQLRLVRQLRAYARTELKLPTDDNYQKYVDLNRPYVVWNVEAAQKFSLQPKTWWYPLVGRLDYRGYFSETGARNYGAYLERKGLDVCVEGVDAYSTLGWFNDPVLNTFVFRNQPELAEVIFHELGHKRVFARGDTDFNEAFATTVGQEGARRWLRDHDETNLFDKYVTSLNRNSQFVHLIMETRVRLENIYGDTRDKNGKVKAAARPPAPPAALAREKQKVFDDLRRHYDELKASWGGFSGYDDWFAHQLNNAKLNTIANYYDYVPGFEALLKIHNGDLEQFYEAADRLAKMPKDKRHDWLRELPKTLETTNVAAAGFREEK